MRSSGGIQLGISSPNLSRAPVDTMAVEGIFNTLADTILWTQYLGHTILDTLLWTQYFGHNTLDTILWWIPYFGHNTLSTKLWWTQYF